MRTSKYFKYLMPMITAVGTSANVFAEQRGLKIYFSENNGGSAPQILVTDDNNSYNLPARLTVSHQGIVWANKARYWAMFEQDVTDRVIADYLNKNSKKGAGLKLTFGNFPYEVNMIQWNVMNDLLSSSILNLLDNYRITTTCRQYDGTGWQYTDEHWDMNFFQKNVTFGAKDVPWMEGEVLNGLSSFEIVERSWRKSPLGILINHETNLDDECRTFIKAGWNGKTGTESNIDDYDDENWAFKVKFTLPDIRMRCKKISTGNVDNNITVQERGVHKIEGYISAHQGAVKLNNPADIDKFHFRYYANNDKITIGETSGIIDYARESGDVNVTVVLMRGENVVCSYVQQIHVNAVDPNAAQIAIVFADGKKGYDITVGDENAQVQAIITKKAKDSNGNEIDITPKTSFKANDYYYLYSVDDENIATIDPYSGKITAKKEGDVHVSAVLMYGTTVKSETYTYPLHVFAKHEGLEFRRINTYRYTTTSNNESWKVTTTNTSSSYQWNPNNLLRVNTTINGAGNTYGVNDWKQIASFSTNASERWRAICQEIAFDVYVPKYTKSITQYSFAGNAAIGEKKTHQTDEWVYDGWLSGHYKMSDGSCKYGFEINYLNQRWVNGEPVNEQITLEQANTKLQNRSWNTNAGSVTQTFARSGAPSYTSNVGTANAIIREIDNVTSPRCNENRTLTVYFAVMSYLWNNEGYPGDVSIGFKGTPTYTYYSTVKYYKNDGTTTLLHTDEFNTESKTETMQLYQKSMNANVAPTRTGYTFLGWSTDPNATSAEYTLNGNFRVYDTENGGGMGPVDLYAVWKPNEYEVELRKGPADATGGTNSVIAIYTLPMPEGEGITAPTLKGYDFNGYYRASGTDTTYYYNKEMKSTHVWDRTAENDCYVQARWTVHRTKINLDPRGGVNYGASVVYATYGQAMPTQGVSAPQRTGYVFEGYYYEGNGLNYYNADMTSARTWWIDERTLNPQVTEITLYAKWTRVDYTITLDHNDETGVKEYITVNYGQAMPLVDSNGNTLEVPTRDGYIFLGYSINQVENNSQYYYQVGWQGNLVSYSIWNNAGNGTLYAQWEKTYKITLDADGGKFDGSVDTYGTILQKNEGSLVLRARTNEAECAQVYCSNRINIKPGYKLLGWYTERQGEGDAEHPERPHKGTLVYRIEPGNNFSYHFYAVPNTANAWNADGKWIGTSDLTLYAHYQIIFDVTDDVITFTDMTPKNCVSGEDLAEALKYAKVHGTKKEEINTIDMRYPDTGADGLKGEGIMEVFENAKAETNTIISPNALILFANTYPTIRNTNAVTTTGNGSKCQNLVVTDRYSMRIPLTFEADLATYARDAGIVDTDKEVDQAKNSSWGTLCLPYPIKNNNSDVKLYWLESTANNYMEFEEFGDDAIIPANTPVLYNRTDGKVSSRVTIVESFVDVPENTTYTPVTINYSNPPEGTYPLPSASATIHDWQFIGTLQKRVFYGKYHKDCPADQKNRKGDVYYFKQNKFTHLYDGTKEKMDGGKMNLLEYRAYFYKKNEDGSTAKVSQYSILVVGEEGTLDITDLLSGDGEGDGKIYDLSGVRVMKPVKGRLYIVNGQKKVYR